MTDLLKECFERIEEYVGYSAVSLLMAAYLFIFFATLVEKQTTLIIGFLAMALALILLGFMLGFIYFIKYQFWVPAGQGFVKGFFLGSVAGLIGGSLYSCEGSIWGQTFISGMLRVQLYSIPMGALYGIGFSFFSTKPVPPAKRKNSKPKKKLEGYHLATAGLVLMLFITIFFPLVIMGIDELLEYRLNFRLDHVLLIVGIYVLSMAITQNYSNNQKQDKRSRIYQFMAIFILIEAFGGFLLLSDFLNKLEFKFKYGPISEVIEMKKEIADKESLDLNFIINEHIISQATTDSEKKDLKTLFAEKKQQLANSVAADKKQVLKRINKIRDIFASTLVGLITIMVFSLPIYWGTTHGKFINVINKACKWISNISVVTLKPSDKNKPAN